MKRALVVAIAACGQPAATPVTPIVETGRHAVIDPSAHLAVASEDVTFTVGTNTVPGTVVHPTAPGTYAGLVLMAGSGPTDRDWNSPLIKTTNGSGKLLAEALAASGMVVLRFDKAGVAKNKTPLDGLSFDIYVDEGRAALAQLRARPDVDATHLFVAGHSEGGIHATRVALAEGDKLAGLVLLSAAGRMMKDIVVAQIDAQLRAAAPTQADMILAPFKQALDDFAAGQTIDPKQVTPIPGLQQLLGAFVAPQTAKLARALIQFDPAPALAQVTIPVFVYNGEKDIQVDPVKDATHLADARKAAGKDVTLFLAPNADHVLKHEDKSVADLRSNIAASADTYNAPDRKLDDDTVAAIAGWLAKH